MAKKKGTAKLRLVVSDEKTPAVKLRAGERLEVVAVEMITTGPRTRARSGARLCGGTDTCLALTLVDRGDPAP
jgi:hypothetical protein